MFLCILKEMVCQWGVLTVLQLGNVPLTGLGGGDRHGHVTGLGGVRDIRMPTGVTGESSFAHRSNWRIRN